MKCMNCGAVGEHYLCDQCISAEVLSKVFNEIRYYKPETCENPYLAEYAAEHPEKYAERDMLPDILSRFDFAVAEYFYCQYYRMRRDDRFEPAALAYLQSHDLKERRSQLVLSALLDHYIPDEFIKPKAWCERIVASEELCCELYATAAKYYGSRLLYYTPEGLMIRLDKQAADTLRYRTKKPYWPLTETRRRAVAMFYDAKGIKYPRIENRPAKVPENEFAPLNECYEDTLDDYCAFWCCEAYAPTAARCIYQIGAVRVRGGQQTDTFESYIRPWDVGEKVRQYAAKVAGVPQETIEGAEDVDLVMPKFFAFVGEDVLVSTGALGNQARLISRAARYAGMKEIKNELFDLLDMAADTSEAFDLANNTREYLLEHFKMEEGQTALGKALINKKIYDALSSYGG